MGIYRGNIWGYILLCSHYRSPYSHGLSHFPPSPSPGPGLREGSTVCRSSFQPTGSSVQLGGRVGTYWAPALSWPSWAQFIFPASWAAQNTGNGWTWCCVNDMEVSWGFCKVTGVTRNHPYFFVLSLIFELQDHTFHRDRFPRLCHLELETSPCASP